MKMLLSAIALMIASPALAQAAPAGGHSGHADHAAQAAPAAAAAGAQTGKAVPATDPHAGHDMSGGAMDCCKKGADGKMACCAKMKAEGMKMACCDKPAGSATSNVDPHAGHTMSPKQ